MSKFHVLSGIDRIDTVADKLNGRRVGLMTTPTGIDHQLKSSIDILHERFNLTALFSVEHGIRGAAQAGEKVENTIDSVTGVPVFSAYGSNSHFSDEMLDAFDVLVFDIQDVGTRFYTYLYSLAYAMEACNRAGKAMIVLDRINPVGGKKTCGIILDPKLDSFVGDYELPTQYGLTIGEFALYVKDYLKLDRVDLTVVPLEGWKRSMLLDDTDLPWVMPSPNCQNLDSALCYMGMCIFEGTNCSEGRGTTIPFQCMGAPFLDAEELERRMAKISTPGIHFRAIHFTPTFQKHQGVLCHGVQMHIIDREICDAVAAGLYLLDEVRKMAGDQFEFIRWENDTRYSLDKLLGSDEYRTGKCSAQELIEKHRPLVEKFAKDNEKYHLYD